jgi:uncharacterized protein YndB with AHSA1/START domain
MTHDKKSFTLSWELRHPLAKVWRALTESNLLEEWIMPNDMKLVVGHEFTFKQDPTPWWDGIVHCKMLEVEPQKRIRYSWRSQKDKDGQFFLDTIVSWTLTPTIDGGTKLSLEQSGFTPQNTQAFGGAKLGWDQNVTNLLKLLDKDS